MPSAAAVKARYNLVEPQWIIENLGNGMVGLGYEGKDFKLTIFDYVEGDSSYWVARDNWTLSTHDCSEVVIRGLFGNHYIPPKSGWRRHLKAESGNEYPEP